MALEFNFTEARGIMKQKITLITRNKQDFSGIGMYAQSIVAALQKDYDITLMQPQCIFHYPVLFKNASFLHITSQDLALPLLFKNYERVLVTVHDIIPLQYPLYQSSPHIRWKTLDLWIFKKTISALKYATAIVCDSYATKDALKLFLQYSEKNIYVVHLYPLEEYKYEQLKRAPDDILYVGSEMPHKNLKTLFKALALIKKEIKDVRLIKIGTPQWPGARQELVEYAKELKIENNIVWKNTVPNLIKEYNTATILVHPSLHEGFGYPIVEAMACGCPVVCSNRTSLPELGGNAVVYFNPTDEQDMAKKIISVIQNKKLQKQLCKKGLSHVKEFTKEQFRRNMNYVYAQVMK